MDPAIILQLLAIFGPPAVNLVTTLITQIENKQQVTATQWAALSASLQQSSQDRMKSVLAANNIDLNSPTGQSLLALAK